jgi:hypothetical protein
MSHPLSIVNLMAAYGEVRISSKEELRCYLSGASRDGTLSSRHRTLRISQRGTGWLNVLRVALGELGSKSWIYREGSREVFTLETTWQAMLEPASDAEGRAFARGYFDAEGGVPRSLTARFYIQLVQKDLEDLSFLRDCLERVGIGCGKIHNPSVSVDRTTGDFSYGRDLGRSSAERSGLGTLESVRYWRRA